MRQEFRTENMTLKVCFTRSEKQKIQFFWIVPIHQKLCIFSPSMSFQDPTRSLSPSSWTEQFPPPPPLFSQSHCVGAKGPKLTNEQNCPLSQQPTDSGTQGSHRTGIVSTVSARRSRKQTLSTNQSQMWSGRKGSWPREDGLSYYYSSSSVC